MVQCGICQDEFMKEDVTHLELYVSGSEGIVVCIQCRVIITDWVRGLRQLVQKGKLLGMKMGKQSNGGLRMTIL